MEIDAPDVTTRVLSVVLILSPLQLQLAALLPVNAEGEDSELRVSLCANDESEQC